MRKLNLRMAAGALPWVMALSLAGCQTAQQQQPPAENPAAVEAAHKVDEARQVAEASLGKQAEILARGDLALNGRVQLLVVNRSSTGAEANKKDGSTPPIFVTRAAVLEKNDGKWSQILLCDEHLKNPNGYLGGSHAARVSGWLLEFSQDSREGLQMNFAPAENFEAAGTNAGRSSGINHGAFHVRWNSKAKLYQSYDASHERYLSEIPLLEI